jgi:aldehyde:ferredoxin oxidoreductase
MGTDKSLQDVLDDSERLQLLQKLINLRQGKGTRESDQIPLRAMGPVYFNEYEARSEYYDQWLRDRLVEEPLPADPHQRHERLMALRQEAYQELCDAVYQTKGYTSEAVPLPETLDRFGLLDEKAERLLMGFGTAGRVKRLSN